MSAHRETHGLGAGYPIGSKRAKGIERAIQRKAEENRRRVKCPHCPVMPLPETLVRHIELCHGEDA